jgi:nucleotide-binding universal stress UspA family protein
MEIGMGATEGIERTVFAHTASEINEAAELYDAGMIVMGSRGRGGMAGLVLGSTVHKMIHLADRQVLPVR